MDSSRTSSTKPRPRFSFIAIILLSSARLSKCETSSEKDKKTTKSKKIQAPVIIGICVATFLVFMVGLIVILRKRRSQKKMEREDLEAREASEFLRDMEERRRRLGSVYTGQRKEMEKTIMNSPPTSFAMNSPPTSFAMEKPTPPPKKPQKAAKKKQQKEILVPDNLW